MIEYESWIRDMEAMYEGACHENAARHGIAPEQADLCEAGRELCPDCPLKGPAAVPLNEE